LGNRSPRLLWDYARFEVNESSEHAAAVLTTLLELEPRNIDARLMLSDMQMRQQHYAEALVTARTVTTVNSDAQRDRVLHLRAFAAMQVKDFDEARKSAEALKR
jgi:Flp pilus assembly protein TadD